jgi:hypothetical protein
MTKVGSAAGIIIPNNNFILVVAPRFFPAFIYNGGIDFIPDSVAMVIAKSDPIIITKIIARSFRPNQIKARGSQHILGNVCNPRIRLPKVCSIVLNLQINTPSIKPNTMEIPYPINRRLRLTAIAIKKVKFLKPLIMDLATFTGAGKI